MRELIIAASFLLVLGCTSAPASDEDSIRQVFAAYWKSFGASDFSAAGERILPEDLIEAKKAILPVFLSVAGLPAKDAQQIASAFFEKVPPEKRSALTPLEVFASLSKLVFTATPELSQALSSLKTEIDRVQITASDATVYYRVIMQGVSQSDTEALVKRDGKWWLRLKEDPRETAKKFRILYKLEPPK